MATDQKYTDDPHISSISGTERSPIAQSGVDLYVTPDDLKTYALNGYSGASSITTVGTINAGTWSGKFAPRVTTTTTATNLLCSPDNFDIHLITALATGITIDIKISPVPNACQRFGIRIKDNGSPQTLVFNSTHVRFLGITNPGTTTSGQTVYFEFEYNLQASVWDCILCTDSTGGGSTSLTATYVGYGDSSNLVTGNSNLTYNSNGTLSVVNTGGTSSSIYAHNNSFNVGGDGPIVAFDGTGSGATLSLGYSSTATFNIRPHSGQLLFEGGGGANGSFNMHGITYITLGLGVGFGFGSITALLNIAAGTSSAGTAPIKLTGGTNLTIPEDGAIEYDSSHLFFTIGSTRFQLDQQGSLLLAANNTWAGVNTFGNIVTNSSTPSIVAGAAAGTSPTVSVVGTNKGGVITIVGGSGGTTPTGIIATITFSGSFAFPTGCAVTMTPANSNAVGVTSFYVAGTTTTFVLTSTVVGLISNGVTYKFNYTIEGY